MYERCKKVIDEWDPIDLLSHAPTDEYHTEIEAVHHLLCMTHELSEVTEGIYSIFIKAFGEEFFAGRKAECEQVAKTLLLLEK